jgi:hypothetical protein
MHEQLNRMAGVSLSAKTFTPKQRLSNRPGRVREDVRADLPQPRNLSVRTGSEQTFAAAADSVVAPAPQTK